MYYRHSVVRKHQEVHYVRLGETHLFGRNVGEIPRLLREQLRGTESEPYPWHLSMEKALEPQGQAIVIDLKPNNKDAKGALSLYELRDVWGFSAWNWTPGMLRLRGICVDGDPIIDDVSDFTVNPAPDNESIYTFLHFDGTIRNGTLERSWTAPRASSTNSALLWPYAISYFFEQIRETSPHVLEPGVF